MLTPLCNSRCVPVFPTIGFAWALSLFLGAQVGLFGQTGKTAENSDSQSGPEAALTNGIWAYYPLDGNASDQSGNEYHGESNHTQLTNDRFGRPNRAFDFDGNNSAVYLPIGSEFNSSVDSLSVSLWAKVRDPLRGTLFEQGSEENLGRDILALGDSNLTSRVGGPLFFKAMPRMNEWRHYLVTYDVSKGTAHRKFYVDGQLFGSDSNDTLENSSLDFILGRDVKGNRPLEGSLDSVRIWRRALSTVQVGALYQIESVNPTPPKVEVSGSVSYDGVVPGPIRLLAYRPNGNLAAQTLLSSGESAFSLSLTDNRSYDLFAFQDRDENGSFNAYIEPGDHYGDWNKSSQSFGLLSVEGDRAGIQLHLTDLDSDEDGYENWYEHQAGTSINDPESIPGMGFGLMGRWRIHGDFNATIEDSDAQKAEVTLRNENNASARYYEVAHRPAFLMDSGAVTIFFKHDSIAGRQGYLSKDARRLKTGGHLSIYQQDGNLTARLQSASKSYSIQVPDCIVPNRWTHLVFQWGPGGMTLWLNGKSVGSDPYTGGLGLTSGGIGNEEPFFIGAGAWKYENEDPSTVVGFFDGEIHLALLHSRKLTPLEIASHHHTSKIAVNRRPYGLTLDQNQISENQSAGTLLGILNAKDNDYNASLTYALSYNGQGGPFVVQPDGKVVTTRPIDYEETQQLELFARVSDEYNATRWKKFVIEVLDLEDTPDPVKSPSSDSTEEETDSNTQTSSGQSEDSENEENASSASGESDLPRETDSSLSHSPQTRDSGTEESNENLDSDSQNTSESSIESSSVDQPPKSDEPGGERGTETPGPGSGPKEAVQPADSEESDLEKGEGKKPGKDGEETRPEMPENEEENSERDPSKQTKQPGKPGSENEDDLTEESGKPVPPEESDLEKGEGKKPGKDKEETDSQMPEKESVHPEEEESKKEKKARLPIVRTLRFDRDENGTFVLAGELLTDGGGTMQEVGILISQKFSFKDCKCKPAEFKGKEGIFRKRLRKLEAGSTYYYRAYARNEVGENQGSIRKLKVPKVEERKAWWSESLEMGGGWRQSEWLGTFRKSDGNDWIFHLKLGWVFARPDSDSGLWLWLEEYGWLWTQKDAWPYLWTNQSADWLYFVTQLLGEALFLRPSDGKLILNGRDFQSTSEKQKETEPTIKEEFTKEPGRPSEGKEKTIRESDQGDPVTDDRITQDSAGTSGKQGGIQEREEVARESMTNQTADNEPVSDRISGETERDGKLVREQTGNQQTISENRQDLPMEREDLSRERNSESTPILERSERSEPEDKQFLTVSAER